MAGTAAGLERAKALGAHTINYRSVPEWGKAAADWTGGGVDHVVEVGGTDTFNQSIEAASVGGTIPVIGVLSGFAQKIGMPSLFGKNLHVIGLSVGSRRMFENLVSGIERNRIRPVVDRTFGFAAVPEAEADGAGRPFRQDRDRLSASAMGHIRIWFAKLEPLRYSREKFDFLGQAHAADCRGRIGVGTTLFRGFAGEGRRDGRRIKLP